MRTTNGRPSTAPRGDFKDHIQFHVEEPESRRLLAGIVKVTINLRGDLVVQGDAGDNNVNISIEGSGQLTLSGFHSYNPETAAQLQGVVGDPANRLSRKIFIDLGDGNEFGLIYGNASHCVEGYGPPAATTASEYLELPSPGPSDS